MGSEEPSELAVLVSKAVKASENGSSEDFEESTLALLKELEAYPITTAQLSQTQAGKKIRPLTKSASATVATAAVRVVAAWKNAVRREAEEGAGVATRAPGPEASSQTRSEGPEPTRSVGGLFTPVPTPVKRPREEDSAPTTPALKKSTSGLLQGVPQAVQQRVVTSNNSQAASIPLTGDKVRDLCRKTFAAALRMAAEELGEKHNEATFPEALAVEVEEELRGQFGGVNDAYKAKFRSLSFNLKDKKNPDLRKKVLLGSIQPSLLVTLSPEDLASDAQREENARIREKKLFDSAPSAAKQATTDQFQCGKCRQRKTTYYQMQTRSADEPMTTFVTCLNCNNRWKFC